MLIEAHGLTDVGQRRSHNEDYILVDKELGLFLVCDGMTGQDAVNSAAEFDRRLPLDGVILTKLDGDTRGGAALSVKAVTGKPIQFIGVGEKPEDFERFHADRLASRILGMGDIVSLVERAQENVDQEEAEKAAKKFLKAEFTFEDFLSMMNQVKKMGKLKGQGYHYGKPESAEEVRKRLAVSGKLVASASEAEVSAEAPVSGEDSDQEPPQIVNL